MIDSGERSRERVQALIERNAVGLVEVLLGLAQDGSVAVTGRVSAVNALLDRAYGKPPYSDGSPDERIDLQARLAAALEGGGDDA